MTTATEPSSSSPPATPSASSPPARRGRWRRRILLFLVVGLMGAAVVAWVLFQWTARATLARAIAEADRLDPGWRLADLMAARRPVAAETNSASRVLEAAKGIPDGWPESAERPSGPVKLPSIVDDDAADGTSTEAPEPWLKWTEVADALLKTPPNVALGPDVSKVADRLLKPVEGSVAACRSLAGAGDGRYAFSPGEVAMAQINPQVDAPRKASRLLALDSARLAAAGKIDEALTSARGIIAVARSIGDEPVEMSQLFRLHQRRAALAAIHRALGQGEASDAALAAVQDDLAREGEHELLLCAMRAQRAAYFDTLGKMADGAYTRYAEGDFAPAGPGDSDAGRARANPVSQVLYMRAFGLYNQGLALSILNQSVEGAKARPFDPGWGEHWGAHERMLEEPGYLRRRMGAVAYTVLPLNNTWIWMTYDLKARMAATRVLLAAERHRRAVGRWPATIEALVPKYLPEIPRGPYSDAPMRLVVRDDGIVAYAVGIKGQDNGGKLETDHANFPRLDVGERLWNPDLRHRPAPAPAPADPSAPASSRR